MCYACYKPLGFVRLGGKRVKGGRSCTKLLLACTVGSSKSPEIRMNSTPLGR